MRLVELLMQRALVSDLRDHQWTYIRNYSLWYHVCVENEGVVVVGFDILVVQRRM